MQKYPTKQDIEAAYERVKDYVHKTPVLTNTYLDNLVGAKIFFKCQNLQKTGAFKVRGAANAILQLKNPKVVTTYSTGNLAQAVAFVSNRINLKCCIVMPKITPDVKVNAVKGYNSDVILTGPTVKQQEQVCINFTKQNNGFFLDPHSDMRIIIGAATVAYEFYKQVPDLDYLIVPIGGGGLCSGSLLSTAAYSPKTIVIGVEPYLARDAYDSLKNGSLQGEYPPLTLAEGVRPSISKMTYGVFKQFLSEVILIQQNEMIEATKLLIERMKMVVELSGALSLAAILKDKRFKGKRVGAVISGGNVDLSTYFGYLREKAATTARL